MKIALFKKHRRDPLSFLISAITRGGYTHAALLIDETKLLIAEAFYPVVHTRPLATGEVADIDFFNVRGLTPERIEAVMAYVTAAVGAKVRYSFANLLRFIPFVRPFLGDGRDPDARAAVFCSQFVFDCFSRAAGIDLLRANSWEVAPSQLAWSPYLSLTTAAA